MYRKQVRITKEIYVHNKIYLYTKLIGLMSPSVSVSPSRKGYELKYGFFFFPSTIVQLLSTRKAYEFSMKCNITKINGSSKVSNTLKWVR